MKNSQLRLEEELYHYYKGINFLEYNDTVEAISLNVMTLVSKKDDKLKKVFDKDNLFSYYIDNKMKLTDEMLSINPGSAIYRQSLNQYLIIHCINNIDVEIEDLVRFTLQLNK